LAYLIKVAVKSGMQKEKMLLYKIPGTSLKNRTKYILRISEPVGSCKKSCKNLPYS